MFFARGSSRPVGDWFIVTFDDAAIRLRVRAPGKAPWSDTISWDSVVRVCFEAEGPHLSDGIYVFTSERPESHVIPTEASGGLELWSEILRRGLFDSELAIEAASSTAGLFCWPPEESAP
jgi:hypothetical protein